MNKCIFVWIGLCIGLTSIIYAERFKIEIPHNCALITAIKSVKDSNSCYANLRITGKYANNWATYTRFKIGNENGQLIPCRNSDDNDFDVRIIGLAAHSLDVGHIIEIRPVSGATSGEQ